MNVPLVRVAQCSGRSATTLPNYDRLSEQFLDEATRHPSTNLAGNVVWGTRYYLESLLAAYEATNNPKYTQAFLDTGKSVLSLVDTMQIVDAPDPGKPLMPGDGPLINVTGWPTWLGSFSVPVMVPTQSGVAALYAQSLSTADTFQVAQQPNGTLQLAWIVGGKIVESHIIQNLSDLDGVALDSLVWGQSAGRIKVTDAGLPMPGVYPVLLPEKTIWNSEQAGGILLPLVHFLLLVKKNPELMDDAVRKEWTDKILKIAADYEGSFVSDGHGGVSLHNPRWLPNSTADLDAAMDYVSVEATLRLFLYELTEDQHHLAIAEGLIQHQLGSHLAVGSQGWLLLRLWPDFNPWSKPKDGPPGNVWGVFRFDPTTPAPVTDGGFFVDLLHYLKIFKITSCSMGSIYKANRAAVQQYVFYGLASPPDGAQPLLRGSYPTSKSSDSDVINPSPDPFAGAGFLAAETGGQSTIDGNWNWMVKYGQDRQGWPTGYFLRAWARAEAAELDRCNYTTVSDRETKQLEKIRH